jgi:hypothetical protein
MLIATHYSFRTNNCTGGQLLGNTGAIVFTAKLIATSSCHTSV